MSSDPTTEVTDSKDDLIDMAASTTSTSTTDEQPQFTPTHTTTTSTPSDHGNENLASLPPPPQGIESAPWPNQKFLIRQRGTNRAISTDDYGRARMTPFSEVGLSQNCHWICVYKDGFFGFKREGSYLGHYNKGLLHRIAKEHREWEYFHTIKHPGGGYISMTLHVNWGWRKSRYVSVGQDGNDLVEKESPPGKVTLWDFLKV